eukprot:CAMPEP_0172517842 /NCGR_PEP_ID=MMETSP1066-20121228/288339_1 /TAXON_ID=671091 /ORGANISM="Coscinodiscus wailesii, Strain CCMP2513" /LENGTH=313 /DNA_ID=CAMNT_0013300023 /DNA_START=84 /DNA_END=1022 /DNA_ORIENTATION=+
MSNSTSSNNAPVLTTIRLTITPYLPPPVISAIKSIDANTADITDEASMLLLITFLLAFITYQSITIVTNNWKRKGYDAAEDDDVMELTSKNKTRGASFSETVLICGPCGAGKTILFHILCGDDDDASVAALQPLPPTVMSMKAAEGLVVSLPNSSQRRLRQEELPIRLIDYPGHPSLRASLPGVALRRSDRVLFVLDSSKSVTEGANVLYLILTDPRVYQNWKSSGNKLKLLVVCNKSDLNGAKNSKRIKIQLRTELERMRKVRLGGGGSGVDEREEGEVVVPLGVVGKSLDLDGCEDLPCDVSFVSVSCVQR